MITFVCDSKSFVKMNKYNIVSIFFRFDFGHVSILMWFLGIIFHKTQMYITHIVVVMEASVECMCSSTYAHLKVKASTLMNKPLIINKIHYICWK